MDASPLGNHAAAVGSPHVPYALSAPVHRQLPPRCCSSAGLGPVSPMHLAAAISTACLLPLLLIDLKQLSRLSVLGSTSTLLVISMVLALLGLDPSRHAMPQQVRRAR